MKEIAKITIEMTLTDSHTGRVFTPCSMNHDRRPRIAVGLKKAVLRFGNDTSYNTFYRFGTIKTIGTLI